MGAAVEGRLDSGHAVGSVSGHLYQALPKAVRSRFVVPPEVFSIDDYDLKYLIILRLALAERHVTYLGAPNPSTFLRLLDMLNSNRERLLDSLAAGPGEMLDAVAPSLRAVLVKSLRADPDRAATLRQLKTFTFANVWPEIRLVTTWTGGSCGIALESVRRTLPSSTQVMELGYQSSECRGTIALQPETPGGLPLFHHHFLEFVRQDAWDSGTPEFLTLGQLEVGGRYYVLFTTAAGLYRYFMNDLVEVIGFFHKSPLMRFVQKGRGVTNLTGEKLYEAQVIEAVQHATASLGVTAHFFVLVADERSSIYRLSLQLDSGTLEGDRGVSQTVDHRLGELNIEYQSKRASGRLGPLTVAWLRSGTSGRLQGGGSQSWPAGRTIQTSRPPVPERPRVSSRRSRCLTCLASGFGSCASLRFASRSPCRSVTHQRNGQRRRVYGSRRFRESCGRSWGVLSERVRHR